jgi:predicted DNA-binding transcriptional regulator YafY
MAPRSERLLLLMQALRRRRQPVSAKTLAQETGVSIRSLYRDIATLRAMGAVIDGEAGVGYLASTDYFLPPLSFASGEIEALVLGLRGLLHGPDGELTAAARDAEAKLLAALPPDRRDEMRAVALFAFPPKSDRAARYLADIRKALRQERVLHLVYADRNGVVTTRDIWPLALGYRDDGQMLLAHCTLRGGFRQFAVNRIQTITPATTRIGQRRQILLDRWIAENGLPDMR